MASYLTSLLTHSTLLTSFSAFPSLKQRFLQFNDLQTGQTRFTFGSLNMLNGIDPVMMAIGLFAVGEVFWTAATIKRIDEESSPYAVAC